MIVTINGKSRTWNGESFTMKSERTWVRSKQSFDGIEIKELIDVNEAIKTELKLIYPEFKKLKL